jgi:hypothetical protein
MNNTGYAPHVVAILKAERDRPRDRLDAEIEVITTVHRYDNGDLEEVETKTIAESQLSKTRKQSGLFKFLGSYEK